MPGRRDETFAHCQQVGRIPMRDRMPSQPPWDSPLLTTCRRIFRPFLQPAASLIFVSPALSHPVDCIRSTCVRPKNSARRIQWFAPQLIHHALSILNFAETGYSKLNCRHSGDERAAVKDAMDNYLIAAGSSDLRSKIKHPVFGFHLNGGLVHHKEQCHD